MFENMTVLLGGLGFTDIKIYEHRDRLYISAKGNVFDLLNTSNSILKDLMEYYDITEKQARRLLVIAGEYNSGDHRNTSELQYVDDYEEKLKPLGIDADSFVYADNLISNSLNDVLYDAQDILNTFN